MTRMGATRAQVQRLVRANPFQPFLMVLENGDRVTVRHPENIALDAGAATDGTGGSPFFYVLDGPLRVGSTFDAVTSIYNLDRPGA